MERCTLVLFNILYKYHKKGEGQKNSICFLYYWSYSHKIPIIEVYWSYLFLHSPTNSSQNSLRSPRFFAPPAERPRRMASGSSIIFWYTCAARYLALPTTSPYFVTQTRTQSFMCFKWHMRSTFHCWMFNTKSDHISVCKVPFINVDAMCGSQIECTKINNFQANIRKSPGKLCFFSKSFATRWNDHFEQRSKPLLRAIILAGWWGSYNGFRY